MDSKQRQKDIFSKNLKYQLNIHNKTQADIVNDLKITSSTVSDWVNAKKYPRMDKVQMIADYLGIYKSDLVEEKKDDVYLNDKPNIRNILEKLPNKAILKMYDKTKDLTEEEVDQILQIIETFEKRKKK